MTVKDNTEADSHGFTINFLNFSGQGRWWETFGVVPISLFSFFQGKIGDISEIWQETVLLVSYLLSKSNVTQLHSKQL